MENITQQTWMNHIDSTENAKVIDVRTPSECANGTLPNAIQIDIMNQEAFKNAIAQLDKSDIFFVYCQSGGRSAQACQYMEGQGLKTYNLAGGMMNWRQ